MKNQSEKCVEIEVVKQNWKCRGRIDDVPRILSRRPRTGSEIRWEYNARKFDDEEGYLGRPLRILIELKEDTPYMTTIRNRLREK